ncbi:MAG: VOC family protein [Betaproteobacteria bacterium]|nr:VOC family protein [Betaproteobacteria bacterium]
MEFDHAVVVVHDQMDQALERFRAMGFFVTERGYHSLGTINHLIILDNSYIELLGYLPENRDKRPEVRDAPAGLNAWVWRSHDASETYQHKPWMQHPNQACEITAAYAKVANLDREQRLLQQLVGDARVWPANLVIEADPANLLAPTVGPSCVGK